MNPAVVDAVINSEKDYGLAEVIRGIDPQNPALEAVPIIDDVCHEFLIRAANHLPGELRWLSPLKIKYRSQHAWGETWADAHHPHKIKGFARLMRSRQFEDTPAIRVWDIDGRLAALDHHRVATARLLERDSILCEMIKVEISPEWKALNSFLLKLREAGISVWFSRYSRGKDKGMVNLTAPPSLKQFSSSYEFALRELEAMRYQHDIGRQELTAQGIRSAWETFRDFKPSPF